MSLGFDFWGEIKDGYSTLATPPTYTTRKKLCENNEKYIYAFICSLPNSDYEKVKHQMNQQKTFGISSKYFFL